MRFLAMFRERGYRFPYAGQNDLDIRIFEFTTSEILYTLSRQIPNHQIANHRYTRRAGFRQG